MIRSMRSEVAGRTQARWWLSSAACLAAAAPRLIDWAYKLRFPRPFWSQFFDPESIYIFDALRTLTGLRPGWHIDNPGVPVEMISAAVVWSAGASPLRYESYLSRLYWIVAALDLLICCVLVVRVFREVALPWRVLAVWMCFLAPSALIYMSVVSPELLYFAVGSLCVAAVWRYRLSPVPRRGDAFLAGLAVGACVALKFTFLAWVPALFAAIVYPRTESHRERVIQAATSAGGMAGGFVALTLPVAGRYGEMAAWLTRLATHAGRYGESTLSLPSLPAAAATLVTRIATAKGWYCLLFLVMVGAIAVLIQQRESRRSGVAAFALVATLASYALAVRHLDNDRYLLPIALADSLLFPLFGTLPSLRSRGAWGLLLVTVLMIRTVVSDLRTHDDLIRTTVDTRRAVDAAVERLVPPDAAVIYSWGVPEPSFALRINALNPALLRQIERRYPRDGHYDPFSRIIYLPAGHASSSAIVLTDWQISSFPLQLPQPDAQVGEFSIFKRPPGGTISFESVAGDPRAADILSGRDLR